MSKQAIYTALSSDTNVTALVGTSIHPGVAPEGSTGPYIVFNEVNSGGTRTMSGVIFDEWYDYDIWLVATTPEELIQLTAAVQQVEWPDSVTRLEPGADGYDFDHDKYTKQVQLMMS